MRVFVVELWKRFVSLNGLKILKKVTILVKWDADDTDYQGKRQIKTDWLSTF